MTLSDAEKFFAKAGCSFAGPQRTARRLWRGLRPLLTVQETYDVSVEWSHVVDCGEGRDKLDKVARKVLARLRRFL